MKDDDNEQMKNLSLNSPQVPYSSLYGVSCAHIHAHMHVWKVILLAPPNAPFVVHSF